jgi:hypothetical protein
MLSWTLSSSPFLASQLVFAALGAVKKAVAAFPSALNLHEVYTGCWVLD